ncbi:MAG: hypothetical protein FMNOHCHN_00483 [Ignavibacteriaceae bacterium]|nr:hypothetical protein [Ignavibacteriaceae bacterium]
MKKLLLSVFFLLCAITTLYAQPSTLSLQGVLRDQTGAAVQDGNYVLVFNIYSTATGGSSLWNETQSSVPVVNGVFSVRLGSVTSFGSLNFTQQYWVGIRVGSTGATELSPRIELTAVPYAFALKGGENVLAGSGNVGIGTLSPSQKLHVNGNVRVDGNMGVGTNSTSYKLDVSGNSNVTGDLRVTGNLNAGSITGPNSTVSISGNMSMTGQLNGKPKVYGKRDMPGFITLSPIISQTISSFTADADMLISYVVDAYESSPTTYIKVTTGSDVVHEQLYTTRRFTVLFPVRKGESVNIQAQTTSNSGAFIVPYRLHIGDL